MVRIVFALHTALVLASGCAATTELPDRVDCTAGACAAPVPIEPSEPSEPVAGSGAEPVIPEAPGVATEMVAVEGPQGTFRIDVTEVTERQYTEYMQWCALGACDETPEVPCVGLDPRTPDFPVLCLSWPTATAYCTSVGKRLCRLEELMPACESVWQHINDGGFAPQVKDAHSCVLAGFGDGEWGPPTSPAAVGSAPNCRGAVPPFDGIFDLIGNGEELVVNCRGGSCYIGGSHTSGPNGSACDIFELHAVDPTYESGGFRCCADGGFPP